MAGEPAGQHRAALRHVVAGGRSPQVGAASIAGWRATASPCSAPCRRRRTARCCCAPICTPRTCWPPNGSRGWPSIPSPTSGTPPTIRCSTCSLRTAAPGRPSWSRRPPGGPARPRSRSAAAVAVRTVRAGVTRLAGTRRRRSPHSARLTAQVQPAPPQPDTRKIIAITLSVIITSIFALRHGPVCGHERTANGG